jgi:hypothetical protein
MDLGDLEAKVAETKRQWQQEAPDGTRRTPATLSPVVGAQEEEEPDEEAPGGRERKPTPLVLIPGGGGEDGEDTESGFEPMEQTPVGEDMPEPSRPIPIPTTPRASAEPGRGHTPRSIPLMDEIDEIVEQAPGGEEASGENDSGEPASGERVGSMLAGAHQLYEQGTYEGSLWLCDRILALQPGNAEAKALLTENRRVLLEQYREQIGDRTAVPMVQVPQHEIMWHKLDHRAGFLLSRIDGQLSFEDIVDVSGMDEFECTRILAQLLSLGVISGGK